MITEPAYRYRASLIRIVDGDTYVLDVDLGFSVHHFATIRLRGYSCPERHTVDGKAAAAHAAFVLQGRPLIVETYKDAQTFARWLADVYVGGSYLGVHLGLILQHAGYAIAT